MSELYPAPPHLSVAVYSDQPEERTFAQMCDVAARTGCLPLNVALATSAGAEFEMVSDLDREEIQVSPDRFERLILGQDTEARALRAGFRHPGLGTAVVGYVPGTDTGTHAVEISIGSDWLGMPEEFWDDENRRAAYARADWSIDVLRAAVERCDPLYGSIGVEFSLPTPRAICEKEWDLRAELFVSRHLLRKDTSLETRLRDAFAEGEVTGWDSGIFCVAWAPYSTKRTTASDIGRARDAAANAIRDALCLPRPANQGALI